jgi:hypothetical protein
LEAVCGGDIGGDEQRKGESSVFNLRLRIAEIVEVYDSI